MKQITIILILLASTVIIGCDESQATQPGFGDGTGQTLTKEQILQLPVSETSDEAAEGLKFMREEEKLARDIYQKLNERWNARVFSNITKSEQQHMDAIAVLLERYGIEDPAAGTDAGTFRNPELQTLYNTLLAKGTSSLKDAMEVGVLIEETDIEDLDIRSTAVAEGTDIAFVYSRLRQGSVNHLNAFTRNRQRLP